jgi:hypothetical protein
VQLNRTRPVHMILCKSRDSAVGTDTGYGQGLRVRVPLHVAQTGSVVHPASYPAGAGVPFPGG